MSPPDEVNNIMLQIDECEFEAEKFDNLDIWLVETTLFKQYKDHLEKRVIKTAAPVSGLFQNRNSPFFQGNIP